MMSAWGWTLLVSGCSLVVALFMGSLMASCVRPVKAFVWIGNAWTELFATSAAEQIFLWYHVIPSIFRACSRSLISSRS